MKQVRSQHFTGDDEIRETWSSDKNCSPETEEFEAADKNLLGICQSGTGPSFEHIKGVAAADDFLVFERVVGKWTHRFRSAFRDAECSEARPQVFQYTELLAPPPFPQSPLRFPLDRSLGEAGCLFQGALILANLLADPSSELSRLAHGQHRLVELGAGTGALSIAAALLGADVTATDLEQVLPQVERNAEANLAGPARRRLRAAPLAWGRRADADAVTAAAGGPADLVLGSDLLYREEFHDALLQTLVHLCHPGSLVVLAYERRRGRLEDSFFDLAAPQFQVEVVPVPFPEDNDVQLRFLRPLQASAAAAAEPPG